MKLRVIVPLLGAFIIESKKPLSKHSQRWFIRQTMQAMGLIDKKLPKGTTWNQV